MPTVVYLVSRFPKVTETFILDEVVGLRRRGLDVRVLSLLRTQEEVVQPGAAELVATTRYGSRSPLRLLGAQLHWARRRPRLLADLWAAVLRYNRSSAGELAKSVVTALVAADWARELEGRRPDRLHAHWATHPALAAYLVGALLELPYGVTAHAHDLYGENGMLAEKLRAADLVVTISEFNRALLRERLGGDAERVRLLHCGVDRDLFRPTPGRSGRLDPLRLLCVASLTDYKGHRHLLEALELLHARGVRVECTLVGDGPLRAQLVEQVRALGLQDDVRLLGRRTAPEVRALLHECDVFVLPSVRTPGGMMEGIPVALMEALASGRPAVATRLSGIPELVEDGGNGLLVPPADPPALAGALQRLAEDDGLRGRLAEHGPRTIADAFDQQANVEQLLRWFTERGAAGPQPVEAPAVALRGPARS